MRTLTFALFLSVLAACGEKAPADTDAADTDAPDTDDHTADTSDGVTWDDVQPIFQDRCMDCHGPETYTHPKLDRASDPRELIEGVSSCADLAYVVPGDPDASFLIWKMAPHEGLSVPERCDNPMPAGVQARPLGETHPDEVELIRAWIAAGAEY